MLPAAARAYALGVALAACASGIRSPDASPERMGECMGDSSEPRGDPKPSTLSHTSATAAAVIAEPASTSSGWAARVVQLDGIALSIQLLDRISPTSRSENNRYRTRTNASLMAILLESFLT